MGELQLSDEAVPPEAIERILVKVGAKEQSFQALVDYVIRNPEALESPSKASKDLGIPIPLWRSIAASLALRKAIFEHLLTSAFNPSVLAEGMGNLAARLTDKRTSTRDLLAILAFIGRVQGIEARARVTHDHNVRGRIQVVVERNYGPEDIVDAEFVAVAELPAESGGRVVPEIPSEPGRDAEIRETVRVSEEEV